MGVELALVGVVVLVPTGALAVLLPATAGMVAQRDGRVGRSVGLVLAANAIGSVAGAALGATVLLPLLSLDGLLAATAGALVVFAGVLAWALRRQMPHDRRLAVAVGAVAILWLLLPARWDPRLLSAGVFRDHRARPADFASFAERASRDVVRFHSDGPNATVVVLERDGSRVLKINGKPDASTRGDMLTQVTSAHVPLLHVARPKRALVVGWGSGVTAGSLARYDIDVDVVEISDAVLAAGAFFDEAAGGALAHPRIHRIRADARAWLATSPARYDVVVSEPSNPWVAGNGALFSVGFFAEVRDHLAEGGVLAQWFHLYEMDDATVALILRTLGRVFPHVTAWQLFPGDLLLVASLQPPDVDLQAAAVRLARPALAADLARVGVAGMDGLLSLQAMDEAALRPLTSGAGPVNTDDRPILELIAPRLLFRHERADGVAALDLRGQADRGQRLLIDRWWNDRPPPLRTLQALFEQHTRYPAAPDAFRMAWLPRLIAASDSSWLVSLGFTVEQARWVDAGRAIADALKQRVPDDPVALHVRARLLAMAGERRLAIAVARRCVSLGDEPAGRCGRLWATLRQR